MNPELARVHAIDQRRDIGEGRALLTKLSPNLSQMAGATTPPAILHTIYGTGSGTGARPALHITSSFSRFANLSSKYQVPRIHRHKSQNLNPRITTCHGKGFDGLDELFSDDDDGGGDDDESDEDDETESSLDLLFRFLQSMFKKVSKRAKKAARSVLPVAMSPQLVSFAVDGVLLLASLSILKAFLKVICTFGGTVFVAILLLRVILATISYFQGGSSFGKTQPVS